MALSLRMSENKRIRISLKEQLHCSKFPPFTMPNHLLYYKSSSNHISRFSTPFSFTQIEITTKTSSLCIKSMPDIPQHCILLRLNNGSFSISCSQNFCSFSPSGRYVLLWFAWMTKWLFKNIRYIIQRAALCKHGTKIQLQMYSHISLFSENLYFYCCNWTLYIMVNWLQIQTIFFGMFPFFS